MLSEIIKWHLALIALGLLTLFSQYSFAQLDCYTQTIEQTLLNENQALQLCCQRSDTAPVRCFESAQERFLLSDYEVIRLCQCATSTEPADCYERAQTRTDLSDAEIINLCAPAPGVYRQPRQPARRLLEEGASAPPANRFDNQDDRTRP